MFEKFLGHLKKETVNEDASADFAASETADKLHKFLIDEIDKNTKLLEIVNIFEKMCNEPIGTDDDMILFETGTYSFTGEKLFYFSLTRQFPNDDEEYYQVHIDAMFKPDDENKNFHGTVWNDTSNKKALDDIRNSAAFEYEKNNDIFKVNIYADET